MSQENLRIVREVFARFGTNDPDFSHWNEDVVITPPKAGPRAVRFEASTRGDSRPSDFATPGMKPGSRLTRCVRSEMSAS